MITSLNKRLGAAAVALSAVIVLLLRFPPDRYSFYPRCPIYFYLHVQCPGCGATRALSALVHGHLTEALRLNPLATFLLPNTLLYAAHYLWKQRRSVQAIAWPNPPRYVGYALLVIATVFTIARNLPS